MQVKAFFKGNASAAKPAKAAAKKVSRPTSGTARTKGGWLGGSANESKLDKWYGPDRALFLPSGLLDKSDVPAYLDGTLPGDYGYDPLGLGQDAEQVAKYRVNELLHARWAMLAAAGIIIPEGLQANGADIVGGTWFETGSKMLDGGLLKWFAVPWGVVEIPLPLFAIVIVNTGLMAAVELYRGNGKGPAGYSPGIGQFEDSVFDGIDTLYPGGPFDPLNLGADPEVLAELKVKEIKNGRLAMVSVLAFAIQSSVTKEGPYANFTKHIADPFGYNLLTILGAGEDRTPTL